MSLCGGGAPKNPEVEAELKRGREAIKRDIKVLLLGAGESGKSTIFKQLKIMNQQGFSLEERTSFREIIFSNIVKNMKSLVTATLNLDLAIEDPDNLPHVEYFNSLDNEAMVNVMKLWDSRMVQMIKALWNDGGVKKAFERRNEFQLDDSAPYYFDAIDRIASSDYVPTEQDVLRTRVKTTGIVETVVTLNNQSVKIIDVGGQRNERKKWIHCFEGVTAIIFVASLSEYDQKCYEDDHTNRMMEALLLFDEICNSRWFGETSVVLFLNKLDLFRDKIRYRDLKVCFKEYDGGCQYDKAVAHIKSEFEAKNRRKDAKQIYTHLTCATDTGQIQMVFNNIKDIILQKGMKENGLM